MGAGPTLPTPRGARRFDLQDGTLVIRRRFFPLHDGVAAVVVDDAAHPAAITVAGFARGPGLLVARSFLRILHGLRSIECRPHPTWVHGTFRVQGVPRWASRFGARECRAHCREVGGADQADRRLAI